MHERAERASLAGPHHKQLAAPICHRGLPAALRQRACGPSDAPRPVPTSAPQQLRETSCASAAPERPGQPAARPQPAARSCAAARRPAAPRRPRRVGLGAPAPGRAGRPAASSLHSQRSSFNTPSQLQVARRRRRAARARTRSGAAAAASARRAARAPGAGAAAVAPLADALRGGRLQTAPLPPPVQQLTRRRRLAAGRPGCGAVRASSSAGTAGSGRRRAQASSGAGGVLRVAWRGGASFGQRQQ